MSSVLLLVGSPRGKKSGSTSIGEYLLHQLSSAGHETETLWIKTQLANEEKTTRMLDTVDAADLIILAAPLYDDCQPYIVVKTMEAVANRGSDLTSKRFMPIINCGFPEHRQITAAAIPIYRMFADSVGLQWAGSLAIAGGEMYRGSQGMKLEELGKASAKIRSKLKEIGTSLAAGQTWTDDVLTAFPEFLLKPIFARLILGLNNAGWKSRAKQHSSDVAAMPYEVTNHSHAD